MSVRHIDRSMQSIENRHLPLKQVCFHQSFTNEIA